MNEYEQNCYLAKWSEQTERYEDMAMYMTNVARAPGRELNISERTLLATAYKNLIGPKRSALRLILYAIPDQPEHCRMVLNIAREKVEGEIEKLCRDVLDLVWDLLRCASSTEYRVYLLKLQGDYTRYLCEMRKGQELRNLIEKAHEYYISATMLGNKCLGTLNQTRLGLALNFSVFFYEVIRDKGRATAIAREAYEAALLEIDMHPERLGRDAALILQLLRDNLIMWEEDSPLSVLNMHSLTICSTAPADSTVSMETAATTDCSVASPPQSPPASVGNSTITTRELGGINEGEEEGASSNGGDMFHYSPSYRVRRAPSASASADKKKTMDMSIMFRGGIQEAGGRGIVNI